MIMLQDSGGNHLRGGVLTILIRIVDPLRKLSANDRKDRPGAAATSLGFLGIAKLCPAVEL
jgi:hypothetical protein